MILFSFGQKFRSTEQALRELSLLDKKTVIVDCRRLPNPHHVYDLRSKTGLDKEVRDWLWEKTEFQDALRNLHYRVLNTPGIAAVGATCIGGRHRSVLLIEELQQMLESSGYPSNKTHMELV